MLLAQVWVHSGSVVAIICLLDLIVFIGLMLLTCAGVLIIVPGLLMYQMCFDSIMMIMVIQVFGTERVTGTTIVLDTTTLNLMLDSIAIAVTSTLLLFL